MKKILIFKINLSRYYRFFVVCPGQTVFLCVRWKDRVYLDRVFSFGNRGACLASQRASHAIAWAFRTQAPAAPGQTNHGINCRCSGPC